MDEANKAQRSYTLQILILTVSLLIVNTGFGIVFPVFPKFLQYLGGGDAADLGLLAATYGVTYMIASPIFGNLADKFGKKQVILFGLFGFIISNLIYVLATSVSILYIARAIEGIFSAAVFPPSMALITTLAPAEKKGKYIGYLAAGQTTGIIIGPVLGGFLLDGFTVFGLTLVGTIHLPFYTSVGIGIIAFLFALIFIENSGSKVIIKAERSNGFNLQVKETLQKQYYVLPNPKSIFMLLVIVEIFALSAWLIVEPGFVFHFYDNLFLSPTDFGIWVAMYGTIAVLGQTLFGNLSDKYGRLKIMYLGQILSLLFYLLLPLAKTMVPLLLVVPLVGLGSALREPATKALLSDVSKEEHRATVFGIESGFMSIAQIFPPIIGGILYEAQGIALIFILGIGFATINLFLIPFLKFQKIVE
ncbi:MAG: MFS transporter [Candidatus Heimdallarchaeota archaeon]|nr:MFS transporter [Candidatus Heimdallarchaeota archaeon]